MKKIVSLFLALIMVMSLNTVAFATETTSGTGDYSTEVTGSYVAGTTSSGTIFSVEIDWTAMSFTYHAEKAPVWDPVNHKYSDTSKAYWEGEGTITVTNHSNAKISATPKYNAAEGFGDATMNFSPSNLSIASAESGSEQVGTITVTPDGFLPKMDAAATIGSITVTIAHDQNVTVTEMEALIASSSELSESIFDNEDLQTQLGDTFTMFNVYISVAEKQLERYQNGEESQETLNEAYADLLNSYNEVQSAMG